MHPVQISNHQRSPFTPNTDILVKLKQKIQKIPEKPKVLQKNLPVCPDGGVSTFQKPNWLSWVLRNALQWWQENYVIIMRNNSSLVEQFSIQLCLTTFAWVSDHLSFDDGNDEKDNEAGIDHHRSLCHMHRDPVWDKAISLKLFLNNCNKKNKGRKPY